MSEEGNTLNLQIARDEAKTERRQLTEVMLDPSASNAGTCMMFMQANFGGGAGLTEAMQVLSERSEAVGKGDASALEETLVAQTAALNSMFVELSRRAHLNLGQHMDATDRYMRLALKAQSQCRMTIETLTLMKNPPVFAKQANINNGGQQQVNNGVMPTTPREPKRTHAGGKQTFKQTKLLEASHGQRMDTRTKSKARRGDQALETVGEIHRAED